MTMAFMAGFSWCMTSISYPAHAIDCSKAGTTVETTICTNDALLAADKAMSDAYSLLAAELADDARQALKQSQRNWIKRRGWCEHSDKPVSQCVLQETLDRTKVLAGLPQSGPGTGSRMVPVILMQTGDKSQYEVDVTVLRFAKPSGAGEILFNSLIEKLRSEAPMGPQDDIVGVSTPYSYQVSMSVPYASPAFISAKTFYYDYSGGAHGNSAVRNINVDLKSGQAVELDSMFVPSAKQILVQGCFAQIQQAKKARMGNSTDGLFNAGERRQIVNDTVSEMTNWSFTQGGASVVFDPYVIGAYAEGRYECTFEMAFLRALMHPTSPLANPPAGQQG